MIAFAWVLLQQLLEFIDQYGTSCLLTFLVMLVLAVMAFGGNNERKL